MSSDVFLQGFPDYEADRADVVRPILLPWYEASASAFVTEDGYSHVYGPEDERIDGLMFNHVDGQIAWDLIYQVAVAAHWVVMPVGCPTCVVSDDQIAAIPEELGHLGVRVVRSGADILRVITES